MLLHELTTCNLSEEELAEGWRDWAAKAALAGSLAAGGAQARPAVPYKPVAHAKQKSVPVVKQAPVAPVKQKSAPVATQKAAPSNAENILLRAAKEHGISGTELAAFMAQCAHETLDFTHLKEIGGSLDFRQYDPKFNPRKASLLGNTKPGDGARYAGRGFIQLTGRENYRRAGQDLGLPLEQKPELVEHDPSVAANVAIWFWKNRVKPKVSNFNDTRAVTKVVNPNLSGLTKRHDLFKDYLERLVPSRSPGKSKITKTWMLKDLERGKPLREYLETSFPWTVVKDTDQEYEAKFVHRGPGLRTVNYYVTINIDSYARSAKGVIAVDVSFHASMNGKKQYEKIPAPPYGSDKVSGSMVLATVKEIVGGFIAERNPDIIYFSAASSQLSKAKLYARFSKSLLEKNKNYAIAYTSDKINHMWILYNKNNDKVLMYTAGFIFDPDPEFESIILDPKDPKPMVASLYLYYHKPIRRQEIVNLVASTAKSAFNYAKKTEKPFPAGEAAIARDPEVSAEYKKWFGSTENNLSESPEKHFKVYVEVKSGGEKFEQCSHQDAKTENDAKKLVRKFWQTTYPMSRIKVLYATEASGSCCRR